MIEDSTAAGSVMLAVFAEFLDDSGDGLVNQIRAELAARRPQTPRWLDQLGQTRIHRAMRVSHVLDSNDVVLLQFRVPTVGEFTCAVELELEQGDFVRRVNVLRGPLEIVLNMIDEPTTDIRCEEVDLTDIRARLMAAIGFANLISPREASGWPEYGALIEWLIRDLPDGGSALPRPEWTTGDVAALITRFSASDGGTPFGRRHAELLESLVEFGTEDGAGDPMRWNERRAERWLFDHLLSELDDYMCDGVEAAPYLLRAFVRFTHGAVGIRPDLTDEVLASLEACEVRYFATVRHRLAADDADWFDLAAGDR